MKAYTDIEQSKRLSEILPIESADMYYQYVLPKSGKIKHNPGIGNPENALKWYNKGYTTSGKEPITLDEYCIPCWSLAALLEVLPTIDDGNRNPVACKDIRLNKWHIVYHGTAVEPTIDSGVCDNLIDACYEMILKLHEFKML